MLPLWRERVVLTLYYHRPQRERPSSDMPDLDLSSPIGVLDKSKVASRVRVRGQKNLNVEVTFSMKASGLFTEMIRDKCSLGTKASETGAGGDGEWEMRKWERGEVAKIDRGSLTR